MSLSKSVRFFAKLGELSASEKKKLARKAKKAEQQQQAAQAALAAKNPSSKKVEDEDPFGQKLVDLTPNDLVTEAVKFVMPLQEFSPENLYGWLYGVEFYTRQSKYLLAWRSLKKAHKLSPSHPLVYEWLIKFHSKRKCLIDTVEQEYSNLSSVVQSVLVSEFENEENSRIVPKEDSRKAQVFLQSLIADYAFSSPHVLSAISLLVGFFNERDQAHALLSSLLERKLDMNLETATELYKYACFFGGKLQQDFEAFCRSKFKYVMGVFGV